MPGGGGGGGHPDNTADWRALISSPTAEQALPLAGHHMALLSRQFLEGMQAMKDSFSLAGLTTRNLIISHEYIDNKRDLLSSGEAVMEEGGMDMGRPGGGRDWDT